MTEHECELRRMDRDTLRRIYAEHLVHDFPPAERKPLRAMEKLMDAGRYEGYTLNRPGDNAHLAYVLLWTDPESGYTLLDYLGLCRGQAHGAGLGSAALSLLREAYFHNRGLLVEAEAVNVSANGPTHENAVRMRRLSFYRRAGFRDLGYTARIFGVCYAMLFSGEGTEEEIVEAHQRLYHYEFNPWLYRQFVHIPG